MSDPEVPGQGFDGDTSTGSEPPATPPIGSGTLGSPWNEPWAWYPVDK